MPTVTLLIKARSDSQLKQVDKLLQSKLEGLKAQMTPCTTVSYGWVQTTISGEDETIALNYLTKEIGLCPIRLESVHKFSTVKGFISTLDKNKAEVSVDLGIFSPDFVASAISLRNLQAQLGDGRKIALAKFIELFGFCKDLPLTVGVLNVNEEGNRVEAELAETQLRLYGNWTRSLLDRLIILGASLHEIEFAIDRTGSARDVVGIESSGLFEHAVVCKLGTDAVGLIPKIGKKMPRATFSIFNPKRVLQFLGGNSAFLTSL
jgi:hypothetical protein